MLGLGSSLTSSAALSDAFSPEQINGLMAWFDFTDITTVFKDDGSGGFATPSHGENISKVTNKAATFASSFRINDFVTQTISSKQPTISFSRVNGLNAMNFTAGGDYLESNKSTGNVATNQMSLAQLDADKFTAFVVYKKDGPQISGSSANDDEFVFGFQDPLRKSAGWVCDAGDDHIKYHFTYNSSDNTVIDSNTAWPSSNFEYWSLRSDSEPRQRIYKNGIVKATTTTDFSFQDKILTANSSFIEFTIASGFGHGTGRQFTGEIAEIIMYTQVLTDEQFNNVNNYLSSKYAL
tara:strand:+ start:376 stop:1257 length:882 start_codon:yes stop_codon:yes gene_type:complete